MLWLKPHLAVARPLLRFMLRCRHCCTDDIIRQCNRKIGSQCKLTCHFYLQCIFPQRVTSPLLSGCWKGSIGTGTGSESCKYAAER